MKQNNNSLLFFLIPAMILPGIASLFYFVWCKEMAAAQYIYFGTKIFTLGWPLFGFYVLRHPTAAGTRPSTGSSDGSRSRPCERKKTIISGVIVGILIFALLMGLAYTPLMQVIESGAGNMREKALSLGFFNHFIIFSIFLSLAHSAIEEYYWRWFVYGWTRKLMKPFPAIILASSAFGLHHFVVINQYFSLSWAILFTLAVIAAGAIWCFMFEKQGNILGSWISHVFADAAIMWVGYGMIFAK